jgi:hypothetical protein
VITDRILGAAVSVKRPWKEERMMHRKPWLSTGVKCLIAVAFLVSTGCLSCNDDKCTNPGNGDDIPLRTTPDDLMEFLAWSYEARDLEHYDEALHQSYTFEFVPEVADSLGLPPGEPWWGKTGDVVSTQNMFESSDVMSIQMDLVGVTPWSACTDEATGLAGMCRRVEPDIKVVIDTGWYETLTLWVNNSLLDITVVQDPHESEMWQILRIAEIEKTPTSLASGPLATEPSTWSSVKAWFK